MRAVRKVLTSIAAVATVVATGPSAVANGGASLDFDRTHYLAGDEAVATTYVHVPMAQRHLFDRGPFHLFAVPNGVTLREGRPIPAGTIRLGTFAIEPQADGYIELRAAFTVPDLPPDFYVFELCNDPCTTSGFREPLAGSISIVATRREARLLVRNERLRGELFGARRQARRAERRLERVEADLEAQLSYGSTRRAELAEEIERLATRLASTRADLAAARERAAFDPWIVGAVVAVGAAAIAFRRRRPATIERLEDRLADRLRDDDTPPDASSGRGSNGHRRPGVRIGAGPR